MTAPAIDRVLGRLRERGEVKPRGKGWRCLCPAHADTNPSLDVDYRDGRVLLICRSRGCSAASIAQTLGLTFRDLFDADVPSSVPFEQRVLRTYDYCDERGTVLFQAVRLWAPPPKNKDFRQRRPDGKGGWVWKLDDVRRVPYRLPELLAADPAQPVFVVEGEKDADRLAALGLIATTNPMGAGKWRKEFAAFFRGRHVVILPDNDVPGREHAAAVVASLKSVAASLKTVELPGLPPKGDVSDFLDAGGTVEALLERVNDPTSTPRTDPPTPQSASSGRTYLAPKAGEAWDDPHRLARLYVDDGRTAAGEPTVLQWRDEYHRWGGAAWRPVADADLDAQLARHCRSVFEADYPFRAGAAPTEGNKKVALFKVTAAVKTNMKVNLSGLVNHPDAGVDAPFWRGTGANRPDASEVIAAPNGLFMLDDIAAGRGPFSPPTPLFFTPNALPFVVQIDPPEPTVWLRCLSEWFSGDVRSTLGLQEFMGYLLSSQTRAHKIGMIVGPPRGGKGTFIRVTNELIGTGNVASTTFAALGDTFGLEPLLGKRIAVIPDARLSNRSDLASVVERLLSISGEDAQSVNRKNRTAITTTLKTRFLISTNVIPQLPDSSGALASRFHILSFPNCYLGKEDKSLMDKLRAELPGILVWAAKGYVRFRTQGFSFTANDAATQYQRELEDLSSPVRAFVRERCDIGPGHEVRVSELFGAWKEWNEARNRSPGTEQTFGRDLHAAYPHLQRIQPRLHGCRVRAYRGIGLRARDDWGEDDAPELPLARGGTRANLTYAKVEEGELEAA
jgi:putative DNA primase/helicase